MVIKTMTNIYGHFTIMRNTGKRARTICTCVCVRFALSSVVNMRGSVRVLQRLEFHDMIGLSIDLLWLGRLYEW